MLLLIDLSLVLGKVCLSLLLFPCVVDLLLYFDVALVSLCVPVGHLLLT